MGGAVPAPFPGAVGPNVGLQPGPSPYAQAPAPVAGARATQPVAVPQGQLPQYPSVAPYPDAPGPPLAGQPTPYPQAPAPTAVRPPSRYPIDDKQVRSYANLYSIIATIDVLQQAFAEGHVDEGKRDTFLKSLLQQFDTVIKGLQITIRDVERFCDASEVSCFYARPVLTNPPEFNKPPAGVPQAAGRLPTESQGRAGVAFDVSQKLVELSDMCHLSVRDPQIFREKITEIRSLLQAAGAIPGDPQITAFVDKWYQYFRTLPDAEVPLSKIGELKPEASDCNIWARGWFTKSMSIC
jgi:hypothetical protein